MSIADNDPFVDPTHVVEDGTYVEGSTLAVGRSASLTLATDSLIVLGALQRMEIEEELVLRLAKMKN